MAAELQIIPKAETIIVHTGNIVNWNRLKKRAPQKPAEEVLYESYFGISYCFLGL